MIHFSKQQFSHDFRSSLFFLISWVALESMIPQLVWAGCTSVGGGLCCIGGGMLPNCGTGIHAVSHPDPKSLGCAGVLYTCVGGGIPTVSSGGSRPSTLSITPANSGSSTLSSGASRIGSLIGSAASAIGGLAPPPVPAKPGIDPNPAATTLSSNTGNTLKSPQREETYSHYGKGTGDMCSYSDKIDHKYGCDTTYNTVQMANMSNMLSMTAGSMATATLGQSAQSSAIQQGTQVAALNAAADMQKNTASMQLGLGAMNTALSVYQLYKGNQHANSGRDIENATSNTGALRVQKVMTCSPSEPDCNNATQTKIETESQLTSHREAGMVYSSAATGSVQDLVIKKYRLNAESGYNFTAVTAENPDFSKKPLTPQEYQQQKQIYDAQVNQRNHEADSAKRSIASSMQEIGQTALSEQRQASAKAFTGGMMSLMFGSQQLLSGGMSMVNANRLKAAAAALKNTSNNPSISFTPPTNTDLSGGSNAALSPNTITGSGVDPNANTANDQAEIPSDAPPDLGKGFNPLPMNSGVPGGPAAGKFNEGNPQGGGGGGGPAMGSSSGTAPDKTPNEEAQPKLAPNEKVAYESGGTFTGNGGGGKGADGGPDLSGLLAKFLPKKEDAESPRNSILQFGKDAPSDGSGNFPALDRNTNIFERIHQTYQDKNSHGSI